MSFLSNPLAYLFTARGRSSSSSSSSSEGEALARSAMPRRRSSSSDSRAPPVAPDPVDLLAARARVFAEAAYADDVDRAVADFIDVATKRDDVGDKPMTAWTDEEVTAFMAAWVIADDPPPGSSSSGSSSSSSSSDDVEEGNPPHPLAKALASRLGNPLKDATGFPEPVLGQLLAARRK